MRNTNLYSFNNTKIGIVGCGHLGQAIAASLVNHGFFTKNLYLSHNGNPYTAAKIERLGLTSCISENGKISNDTDIVFLTVKPQDIIDLQEMVFAKNILVVSCIAGLSTEILKRIFNTPVSRIMLSGPDTIISERGIAAMYPYNKLAGFILEKMRLHLFEASNEQDIDIFTTGVCLPAALLLAENEITIKAAIQEISEDYAAFSDIYKWAQGVLPFFNTANEEEEYIAKMITPGGVTEIIVNSLKSGDRFITALRKGMTRLQGLSEEIRDSVLKELAAGRMTEG